MMEMKKLTAVVLSVITAASVLSACGKDKDDSKAATTTKATTPAVTTAATTTAAVTTTAAATTTAATTTTVGETTTETWPVITPAAGALVFDDSKMDLSFVHAMAEKDYKGTDESHVKVSIAKYNGEKMLKVETLDQNLAKTGYKIPKLQFDMQTIFKGKEADLPKIAFIEIDAFYVAVGPFTSPSTGEEAQVPGNFMGAIATQPYNASKETTDWKQLIDFSDSEWTKEWGYVQIEAKSILGPFVETTEPQYLTIMRWSIPNDACFYIKDITFLDENKEVIATALS
ncbi:MAG: hypothetical protein QM689_01975 [Oscillospiraceae bacterium]